MQYYLAIKAQIVVPEVSYRRFVQKRNLDVKRQWVTVPCVTSKYSKNVSYINVYKRYNPQKETKSPIRCQSLLKLRNANDHVVIHFASNFRVYSYRMTL